MPTGKDDRIVDDEVLIPVWSERGVLCGAIGAREQDPARLYSGIRDVEVEDDAVLQIER